MPHRDPRPIVDPNGSILAVLAGMPANPSYEALTTAAFQEILAAFEKEQFKPTERTQRHGQFPALLFGNSVWKWAEATQQNGDRRSW